MGKRNKRFKPTKLSKSKEFAPKKKLRRRKKKNGAKKNITNTPPKNQKNQNFGYEEMDEEDFEQFLMNAEREYLQEEAEEIRVEYTPVNLPKTFEEHKNYLEKVTKESDILMEVVDCRNVDNMRLLEIEKFIKENNKKLILLLNKSDTLSADKIENIKNRLQNENIFDKILVSSNFICNMTEQLFNEISNFIHSFINEQKKIMKNMKSPVKPKKKKKKNYKLGIFGYPNTGKESLIMRIKLLGHLTMDNQFMELNLADKFCKFSINSVPATCFSEDDEQSIFFSKAVKDLNELKEPQKIIKNIFKYIKKDILKKKYKINSENLSELLENIKKKYEYQNLNEAAIHIINDMNSGKLNFEITNSI